MPTLTINGNSFPDFLQAFTGDVTSPNAGSYYALEPWGDPPRESAPMYEDRQTRFPGKMGIGTKRFFFLGRMIYPDLIIVHTSKAALMTAAAAKMQSFMQLPRYSISLPDGVSRPGCKCLSATETKPFSMGTSYCMLLVCEFIQLEEPS